MRLFVKSLLFDLRTRFRWQFEKGNWSKNEIYRAYTTHKKYCDIEIWLNEFIKDHL